ncbi:MAG: hypothetical protein RLN82_05375, partial [Pseudomonadales bacterium]
MSLLILPTLAYWFFGARIKNEKVQQAVNLGLILIGIVGLAFGQIWGGIMLLLFGSLVFFKAWYNRKERPQKWYSGLIGKAELILAVVGVVWLLGKYWLPLGAGKSVFTNVLFVALLIALILGVFTLLQYYYKSILKWCLANRIKFMLIPAFLILLGVNIWLGFNSVFGFMSKGFEAIGVKVQSSKVWSTLAHAFPGVGEEFMPSLDEGSFLLMPTSMPHSGIEYNRKVVGQLDMLLTNIPEVDLTVGKLGRVESALDPAPISMYENVINYKSEYKVDDRGRKLRFEVDKNGHYVLEGGEVRSQKKEVRRKKLDSEKQWYFDGEDTISLASNFQLLTSLEKQLIEDNNGKYFRNWRPEIQSPDDIWNEIIKVTKIPGVTSAPKLQPIETRLVMLQTGMRAPM